MARLALALLLPAMVVASHSLRAGEEDRVVFARDIRPILSDKCFACHGPDEEARKGKIRLDRKDDALAVREGHAAIVPGKPDDSELVFRIETEDDMTRMPPTKSGKSLTGAQISLLRRWVEQGADYTPHWAFVPPQRMPLPQVGRADWVRSPIDAFVLARLEREGLPPSPEADRTTLIRRLSLDLLGLPPTVEEVNAYLADTADGAYDRLVERLLASPHYGERWARVWLDAARYADSDGYEKDKPRFVWFYRDWVINSLNADMPYNQFIIEQVAGDLLPDATQDQIVATGFLRNSMINEEGGIDPEQFRMEAMFDRMDAIGTGILGLTVRCAQCHNHKYDPLTQEEYYRMFALINDSYEANVAAYTREEQRQIEGIKRETAKIEQQLKDSQPDWRERMAAWESSIHGDQPTWTVVTPAVDDDSTGGQKYLPQPDGSFLAQGYAPTKHRVTMTIRVDQPKITAFRLELLTDPNLPRGGPGRSIKGTGTLSEFAVEAAPANDPGNATKVKFADATADVNPPVAPLEAIFSDKSDKKRTTGPVKLAIDGDDATAWGFDVGPGLRNQARKAVFVAEKPIENSGGTVLTFFLAQNHGGWNSDDNQNCNLGRFRLSITDAEHPTADPVPAAVRQILAKPTTQRHAEEVAQIFAYWRTTVPEWREANDKIDALWATHPEGTTQLALQGREMPNPTHILQRGDFLKPTKRVTGGVPQFLNPIDSRESLSRLDFARWLVDRKAPTTARAMVNRVWQGYFGTGLVETAEDLGSQGAMPSHPELLDWLAVDFMEKGWSLKELHRTIVKSSTYRQSSHVTSELLARDPVNRLLARGPRFRVDAEVVRDLALRASGLLDDRTGGPSVQPPAPEFLFLPPASYGPKVWIEAQGSDRYRRALYTFRFRSVPYPALQAFDAPNGDIACVRRTRSNTPLQALITLNEPIFMECARALAIRALRQPSCSNDAERLTFAFRNCLSREPTTAETQTLLDLLERQKQHFASGGGKAEDLAGLQAAGTSASDLAAWTTVTRVLLNLDETITKE